MTKDLPKIFLDKIYSSPPKKKFSTDKLTCNQIEEIGSIDLADIIDYKVSKNEGYR